MSRQHYCGSAESLLVKAKCTLFPEVAHVSLVQETKTKSKINVTNNQCHLTLVEVFNDQVNNVYFSLRPTKLSC